MRSISKILFFIYLVAFVNYSFGRDVGVKFTETMSGYFSWGNMPYDIAYSQGESQNQQLSFSLDVVISNVGSFIENPDHQAKTHGNFQMDTLVSSGITILNGSYLRLFDHDVENHTLEMHYFIPFQSDNGS